MGLMDKFKNLFTDEEVIDDDENEEVEIKEVKQEEPKLPTFMREKIAKEEQEVVETPRIMQVERDVEVKKEIKLEKKIDNDSLEQVISEDKQVFKFPIDFTENDFVETRTSRQNYVKEENNEEVIDKQATSRENVISHPSYASKKELKVSELYKDKKEEKQKDNKKFRATPIISPIYGVLDKNYDPSEVENHKGQNFEETRPSKSVDFDSVRKKAYGSLTEEIKENLICENCEYLKEAKECRKNKLKTGKAPCEESNDNHYVEDAGYQNITLDEATENYYDYGVAYEKQPVVSQEKIPNNNYYLDEDDGGDVKITDYTSEEDVGRKKEIPPVKSSINLLSTLKKSMGEEEHLNDNKKLELQDDLFNLIDSMYEERSDDK